MRKKELDVLIGVVSRYYSPKQNESGTWLPAKFIVETDEGTVDVSIWPKKDFESGVVYEPIQLPVLEGIDLDSIEGKSVKIVASFERLYNDRPQYGSVNNIKVIDAPEPEPEAEAEAEAPEPTPAPQPMTIDERIRWNSSVNNAVSRLPFDGDPFDNEAVSTWIDGVNALALPLNQLILQGPVEPIESTPEPEEEPDTPTDASDGVVAVDGEV